MCHARLRPLYTRYTRENCKICNCAINLSDKYWRTAIASGRIAFCRFLSSPVGIWHSGVLLLILIAGVIAHFQPMPCGHIMHMHGMQILLNKMHAVSFWLALTGITTIVCCLLMLFPWLTNCARLDAKWKKNFDLLQWQLLDAMQRTSIKSATDLSGRFGWKPVEIFHRDGMLHACHTNKGTK